MTLADALDILVGRTKHERYRWLCSDENPDAAKRNRFREFVIRQASGEQPTEPVRPITETIDLIRRMKACPFWSKCSTGCGAGQCGLRAGARTSHQECFTCLDRYG